MTEKRRSPWPWVLLALGLGFFLVIVLVIYGIASLFSGVTTVDQGGRTSLVAEAGAQGTFVEIPVEGIIIDAELDGPNPVKWVKSCLDKAAKEPDLEGILLRVNSPGGGIRASELILKYLTDFKAEHEVPIVVLMKDVAASGGYYVSMSSDWIVAANETITASIGVIWSHMNWQGLMEDKLGIRFEPIKSAPMKDIGSPEREMTTQERALIQSYVDDAFEQFVTIVVEGRKGKGKTPVTASAVRGLESTIVTGRRALEIGLVDEIGFHDAAVAKLKELAGIAKANVIEYEPPKSLLDMLIKAQAESGPLGMTLRRLEYLHTRGPGLLALWER